MTDPAATEPGSSAETPTPSRPRLSGCAWILICVVLIVATTAFSVLWPIYRGKRAHADLYGKKAEIGNWTYNSNRPWHLSFIDEKTFIPGVDDTWVEIEGGRFTDADVRQIAALRRISSLSLRATSISPTALRGLGALHDVRELSIDEPLLTDADVEQILQPHWRLGSLWLSSLKLSQSAWTSIARCSGLGALILNCPGLTLDDGLPDLSSMHALEQVTLDGAELTVDGTMRLANAPRLTSLTLLRCRLSSVDFSAFGMLDALLVAQCDVAAADARNFRVPPGMVAVQLERVSLTESDPDVFAGLSRLQILSVMYGAVSDEQLHSLAGCAKLEELDLMGCSRVGDAQVPLLAAIPNLKRLGLSDTGVTSAGIVRLQTARPDLTIHSNVKLD